MLRGDKQKQDGARTQKPANASEMGTSNAFYQPLFPLSLAKSDQRTPSEMLKPPPGRSEPLIAVQEPKWDKLVFLLVQGGQRFWELRTQTAELRRGKGAGPPSAGLEERHSPPHAERWAPGTPHFSPPKPTHGWQSSGTVSSWLLRQYSLFVKQWHIPEHVGPGAGCDSSTQTTQGRA